MQKVIHKADTRGTADHGWLKANHSFSFAGYHNPERTRFGVLRVLNDDRIQGGGGFGRHPHDNMEIITVMLEGSLEHKDSMGNVGVIGENEIQVMSAGKGVEHSEYNHSDTDEANLLQIWIFPKERDIEPRYDQKKFDPELRKNKIHTIVTPDGNDDSIWINQNGFISLLDLSEGNSVDYKMNLEKNGVYIFVINGTLTIADEELKVRDAIGISESESFKIKATSDAKMIFIEIPMN